ncbi:hypothetical protein [Corynebacterium sp. sy039]|uniref:hypothetical protein n=1 Tax=Corynebacterium sp. sy039 TaxID=2599641 RepID=UPI0011B40534|nr:hypothetical protein [Corynebacterium sp. sy039]QDZ42468.1 hypothetical protein FQV43_04290 [Corynebacterium sp. sy039]
MSLVSMSVALLAALPVAGIAALWSHNNRMEWAQNLEQQHGGVTKFLYAGSSQVTVTQVDQATLSSIVGSYPQPLNCFFTAGKDIDTMQIAQLQERGCKNLSTTYSAEDNHTINLVESSDNSASDEVANHFISELDDITRYVTLVYYLVLVLPSIIAFWQLSKLFDDNSRSMRMRLIMRGVPAKTIGVVSSAASICAHSIGIIFAALLLGIILYYLRDIEWLAQGFTATDLFQGWISGCVIIIGIALLHTILVTYRRSKDV